MKIIFENHFLKTERKIIMLEIIETTYRFYDHKNQVYFVKILTKMVEVTNIESLEDEVFYINWDNVEEYKKTLHFFFCDIEKTKKGRVIELVRTDRDRGYIVKEWKANFNIRVQVSHYIVTPSMPELMQWRNAFEAIQYMAERGIQVTINTK